VTDTILGTPGRVGGGFAAPAGAPARAGAAIAMATPHTHGFHAFCPHAIEFRLRVMSAYPL
jgi:hypothetical protein